MSYATGDKPLGLCDIMSDFFQENRVVPRPRTTNFVKIGAKELAGITTLSDSGNVNMMEIDSVIYFARKLRFIETAEWITNNRQLYIRGIMKGFFHDYIKK